MNHRDYKDMDIGLLPWFALFAFVMIVGVLIARCGNG